METNIDNKDEFGFSVLENTGAPIIVLDLEGRIVLFNPASETLSGYSFADLEGQYFREMLAATDDADSLGESEIPLLVKEIQKGAVRRTYCWQDKDGKNHFVEWVITSLLADNGKVEHIILTGLDETDHHRSELELAHSEEQYREIVENSQEGFLTIDLDNRITFVNAKLTNMLGYSVEEVLGEPVFNFTGEEGQAKIREVIERRKAGIKEQYALPLRHRNGATVWAELNAAPLLNDQGVHVGSLATVTDITERRRTEEELARLQRMLEQANDVAKMGAWEVKLNPTEVVYSDVLKEILEVEPDFQPSLEKGINFYKPGKDRDRIREVIDHAIETGEPWDEEFRVVTAKGNDKWVRAIGHAEFVDNTCERLYGSFQDITARIMAEQELERIFELSLDIIGTGNLEGYFTRVNSSVKRLLGYESEEFCSKPFLEFIHPEDVEKTLTTLQAAQTGEQDLYVENRYICKDGSIKWIAWTVLALVEENKFYATGRDNTDRKLAEEELARAQRLMQQANEVAKLGAWEYRPGSEDTAYSDVLMQILDIDADFQSSLEAGINFVKAGEDRDRVKRVFENAIAHGAPWDDEFRLISAKGNEKWVRVIGHADFVDNTCQRVYGSIEDITERKLAEQEFERIFDLSPDLIGTGNLQGYFTRINPSVERLFGYSVEEFLSTPFIEFVYEEDVEKTLATLQEVRDGKRDLYVENRYVCKDGSIKWIAWSVLGVAAENKFYVTGRDYTDRKLAEEALKKNEAILEKAQEIAHIGHFELDAASREVQGSDELFKIFGISREGSTFDSFVQVFHPEDRERNIVVMQRGLESGESWDIEHRLVCRDGTEKWVRAIGEAVTDASGKVVQLIGTVQDITQYKEARQALLESELWMKNIFNSLDEAVLVVSAERELINVNQAALTIFGYTQKELMTSSTELLHVDHEHYLEFGERIAKAFSEDKTAHFEFVAKRKNGEIFPSEHTVSLLKDPDGKVIGIVSVVKDITERKNAEAELEKHRANLEDMVAERTAELRNAQDELVRSERLATLGQLTATVSHELRNPLGAMRPSIYLIKKYLGDNVDEKLFSAIERLDRNITRCDHIIDELLDFTRVTDLTKTETLIDQWLDSVVEEQLIPDNVKLVKKYSLVGVRLAVDTNRLQRVIINILENACQAMQGAEPGSGEIAEGCLTVATRAEGDRIEISISDTGSGIPADVLPHIFEPLFSTKNFGVGLGMPTVQQIMVQHGGGVDIRSAEGKGTTVTLWLPSKDSS